MKIGWALDMIGWAFAQPFPTLATPLLRKYQYCIFYGYNLLTWVCHVMSGHGMLKYFRPITHKKDAPEDKDPPEGKELSNLCWPYLSKVIPPSSSLSIASYPAV